MSRICKILSLSPSAVAEINATIRANPHLTLDELLPLVQAHGVNLSRSALGRYRQRLGVGVHPTTAPRGCTVVLIDHRGGTVTAIQGDAEAGLVAEAVRAFLAR